MNTKQPSSNAPSITSVPRPNQPCWCGSKKLYKRCHMLTDPVHGLQQDKQGSAHRIQPGIVSPGRPVPANISRPDYARTGKPRGRFSSHISTPEQIARIRNASQIAAQVLQHTGLAAVPGVTTDDLDVLAHEECLRLGAYPSPLNYSGFPKSICTSVNEVICHGIPDNRKLRDGDILSIDITVYFDGMHGDTCWTFLVGDVDDESRRLVKVTEECLQIGIQAVRPGQPIGNIGRAIEAHATNHQLGVVRTYCGHGIGEQFHTSLVVPHFADPTARHPMMPGMVFTIEPMLTLGTWKCRNWKDGWTAVTADNKRSAQCEHTICVTQDGATILTLPPPNEE